MLGQPLLEPTDHLEQKQLEEQLSSLARNVSASHCSWQDEPGQGQAVTWTECSSALFIPQAARLIQSFLLYLGPWTVRSLDDSSVQPNSL